MRKIFEILQNYKRVLTVAKKATKEEFISSTRICAIGVLAIGIIGFIIYLIAILLIG